MREAQALARVAHPNTIAVYEAGQANGRWFVATEYVDGVTLRQWLRDRPRTVEEIVSAFTEAGRGLAAVHAAGFVQLAPRPNRTPVSAESNPGRDSPRTARPRAGASPPARSARAAR